MRSGFANQLLKPPFLSKIKRPQTATLVILGAIACLIAIALGWFSGSGAIAHFFSQVHRAQQQSPFWLELPDLPQKYLWMPTIILAAIAFTVTKICPKPTPVSRAIVVGILLALTIRYLLWRSVSTLNVGDPLNGIFSLGLLWVEIYILVIGSIQLYLLLKTPERNAEADRLERDVLAGQFLPTVDILIPTYDEPSFILRRTVIGCQALDYPHKTVYLLDDTRRPEVKQLAEELGCHYLTRPDNFAAKAGNLNHALEFTEGELVAVFDADFIPTKNFLNRTVGFFQDEKMALVQTPQSFYNPDPIARNLGLENIIPPEEEVFYRQIQPFKDGAGSLLCAGTSFVVRRTALERVGGFVTESISEDYFTGIRLSAVGYKMVYLNEKLSAGLAAETIAEHLTQRTRWARGTLQAFFIDSNPLTIPGLTFRQRLGHLEGLLYWFTSISRVFLILMPLAYAFLGVVPLRTDGRELLYFFIPYYCVSLLTFSWLNRRSRSAFLSEIYAFFPCFPLAFEIVKVMLNPFDGGFKVTKKGTQKDDLQFSWKLGLPIIMLFFATLISLFVNWQRWSTVANLDAFPGVRLGLIWSVYNLIILAVTLLILIDIPKPDGYEWLALRRVVKLKIDGQETPIWGVTNSMSEVGMEVALTQNLGGFMDSDRLMKKCEKSTFYPISQIAVNLTILDEKLSLKGAIAHYNCSGEFPTLRVAFEGVTVAQHRKLVEMLFCRPGQWKDLESPGELRSLWLLFKVLLKPRFLCDRNVRAIRVSQV
ncbi:glycosyltransferase [Lyngbya sp. CCY1209]|uniref:glycosyltransferase n=1 Tax=Lyngbya sp. CCY1209 TaxID=2886103 RepID=UPI002D1FFB49|nr:glycosyltransferase [Lyngbya sp. CCY1209]MEB3882898.1 glycosyltransferase [Lyngbya sp. CCY1209]